MAKGERGTAKPYLRGTTWWINYSLPGEGRRFESSGSSDKQVALRLLRQRLHQVDEHRLAAGKPRVADLLELYLADQRREKRHAYRAAEGYVRLHLLPAMGSVLAEDLTTVEIARFVDEKLKRYANATVNQFLKALKRGFTLGLQAQPPLVHRAPYIRLLQEDNAREGFLDREGYLRMLAALPPHQQMLLVIGYHLGMRSGEILDLRWNQVDWSENLIRLKRTQTKSKHARVAPMYGDLRAWLERAHAARDGAETIVSFEGHRITETKTAWHTARVKAGLPDLLIHDLRRTAVRNMVNAGISEKQAMLISGHRTRNMFDRYHIVDESDAQVAGRKLAAFHRADQKRLDKARASEASGKVVTKVETTASSAKNQKARNNLILQ